MSVPSISIRWEHFIPTALLRKVAGWAIVAFGASALLAMAFLAGRSEGSQREVRSFFPTTVDYSQSLEQAIGSCDFAKVCSVIRVDGGRFKTENFPAQDAERGEKKQVVMTVFHFPGPVTSQQAIEEMAKQGCRPANTRELCAFFQAEPSLSRRHIVLGLGSLWDWNGKICVPDLDGSCDGQYLHLVEFNTSIWRSDVYRFLAVAGGQ